MGGQVLVGIKKDGKETFSSVWTNSVSSWFWDMKFQNAGSKFDEVVKFLEEEPVNEVFPEEYGIILIDFDSKEVLSINSYTYLESFLLSFMHGIEKLQLCLEYLKNNKVQKVLLKNNEQPIDVVTNAVQKCYNKLVNEETSEQSLKEEDYFLFEIYPQTDFHIVNDLYLTRETWEQIQTFLRVYGWKTPTASSEKMNCYFEDRECD
jgi:isopentenyldiphosphate isomerase